MVRKKSIDGLVNNNSASIIASSKEISGVVTLNDIAERCGVTKATVSRALSGKRCISAAMIDKIQHVANELGYNPAQNDAARRLSFKKSGHQVINHVIALFWPPHTYQSEYFGPLHHHIINELTEQNFAVLTLYFHGDKKAPQPLPRVFDRGDVDGGIIFGRHWGRFDAYKQLRANPGFGSRPLISITTELFDCSALLANEEEGVRDTVRHLLALGHKHFLHFTYPRLWGLTEPESRIKTIQQELIANGLNPDTNLHLLENTQKSDEPQSVEYYLDSKQLLSVQQIVDTLSAQLIPYLKSHPEITAILALNDANAIHTWLAIQQAGYSIPNDYSIVGFDDTTVMLDQHSVNQLSSVKLPLADIGKEAAKLVVSQIISGTVGPATISLPTAFVPRGSVGPAKK